LTAKFLVALTVALVCGQASAVNKCTLPDGKVVFQDAPCTSGKAEALNVKPARGRSDAESQPTPSSANGDALPVKPLTEAQRIEQRVAESQRARRRQELEVRLLPESLIAIDRHRAFCDQQLAQLQNKKRLANNNLAGATWEGSISSEMVALATRCDTQNRELRDEAERRRAECRALGGCQ